MSLKIAVLTSTNRPTRRGRVFADWLMTQLPKSAGVTYDLIDIAEENLPWLDEPKNPMMGDYELEYTKKWAAKIASYDGFIIVTAEYNHGYAAPLKNAIDILYAEWHKKPVGFVGYGTVGAARAIEQLGEVFLELKMVPITSNAVRIINPRDALDEQGQVKPEHLQGNIQSMTDELIWWANALQVARQR